MILLTGKENPRIKNAVRLASSAKARREQNRFFCEGLRLVSDAVTSGVTLHEGFVTERFCREHPEAVALLEKSGADTVLVSEELMKKLCGTETPQGICAVGEMAERLCPPRGKFAVFDRVQDPANLGAVARTAEALGVDGLLLSADSCDPANPKALRASMGAFFRLPVRLCPDLCGTLRELKEEGCLLYGAVVRDADTLLGQERFPDFCALVIGNEANGICTGIRALCDKHITIPMAGRAESLNASAAAAILLWEMTRRNHYDG